MFTRAKKILASELMYALDKDEERGRGAPRRPADRSAEAKVGGRRRLAPDACAMAVALLVAAGRGERLGADRPKAFVVLAGRPMLEWSLDALRGGAAVVGGSSSRCRRASRAAAGAIGVRGRGARARSRCARALAAAPADDDGLVVVHDAARPAGRRPRCSSAALAALGRRATPRSPPRR